MHAICDMRVFQSSHHPRSGRAHGIILYALESCAPPSPYVLLSPPCPILAGTVALLTLGEQPLTCHMSYAYPPPIFPHGFVVRHL
jgi:hypothetical protein